MRKTALAAVIASAAVITLGGTTALAFGSPGQNGRQNSVAGNADMVYNQNSKCEYCEEYGHHYTDTDNNGICDYCRRAADGTVSYCRQGYSTSGSVSGRGHHYEASGKCGGSGYRHAVSSSCDGTGHHAGHGYGRR